MFTQVYFTTNHVIKKILKQRAVKNLNVTFLYDSILYDTFIVYNLEVANTAKQTEQTRYKAQLYQT